MGFISFEQGVKGIEANEEAFSIPWIVPVNQKKEIIDKMAEDSFFDTDNKSITEAISTLNNVDEIAEATNLYYIQFPEKKKLMTEILEDMQQLLTMKTSMDSSKLREAIVTYNDNLELAQKSYYRTYLRNCCAEYNKNPYPKKIRVYDVKTTIERDIVVGRFENGVFVQYDPASLMTSTERYIGVEEFDHINYNGILSGDSQNITGFFSFLKNLDKSNEAMILELRRRGLDFYPLPERPLESK